MALDVDWLAIDCKDATRLGQFWAEALGYRLLEDDGPDEVGVVPMGGSGPRLLFLTVPDAKTVKNRLHLDLRPDDQAAEVARLESLGAQRVDIGQGNDVTWVVMADPEGNEFCILRALNDDDRAERARLGID
jgi:predicted enzyme related to lactoylglutathione lyase